MEIPNNHNGTDIEIIVYYNMGKHGKPKFFGWDEKRIGKFWQKKS